MTEKLCIATCQNFGLEVSAALKAEGWDSVGSTFFPARCGRPPITWNELRTFVLPGCEQLVIFGSACLKDLGEPPTDFPPTRLIHNQQCFYLVAGPNLVDEALDGGYMITPAWLADWQGELKKNGVYA